MVMDATIVSEGRSISAWKAIVGYVDAKLRLFRFCCQHFATGLLAHVLLNPYFTRCVNDDAINQARARIAFVGWARRLCCFCCRIAAVGRFFNNRPILGFFFLWFFHRTFIPRSSDQISTAVAGPSAIVSACRYGLQYGPLVSPFGPRPVVT